MLGTDRPHGSWGNVAQVSTGAHFCQSPCPKQKHRLVGAVAKRYYSCMPKPLLLYHGSWRRLAALKPRQQMNYSYRKKQLIRDGKPAVCVTQVKDIAIFRSLVHKGWSSFGTANGKIRMWASPEALASAKQAKGYVYIISAKGFRKHSPYEYRSKNSVKPSSVMRTTYRDLPKSIRIIKNWQRWQSRHQID